MSQAGNVLHLYVEVRSGTEEGESRRRSASRHSVSFQPHLQSRSNGESPPMRARSSETECILGRNSQPSPLTGRNTTPTTPTSSGRRSCEVSDTGRRSVVTFSYIEKANVMSVERMPEETLSPTRTNLGHSIARAATHRALEEFGSPQLRCRGANASPILVRALPQKEGNQLGYHNHLSFPTNQMAPSMSPLSKLKSQETAPHQSPGCARPGTGSKGQPRPGGPPRVSFTHSQLNQLSRTKDASPANSPELARKLAEEATKLSSMFKEARKSRSPSPSLSPHLDGDSKGRQSPLEMNIPLHGSPKQLNNWSQGDPSSPAILSTWHRGAVQSQQASPSPIRDPRQQQTITDSPTLHRHLPPQYTGGDWSPRCQSKYSQESDKPAVEQTWEVGSVTPDSDESQSDHNTPNQDQQNVVVTDLDMLAKVEAQAEGSSRSSSGVTGSLVGQPDWDCVSPESSQSSQKSSDTGHTSSGMPSDGSSSPVGPSLHSQRIARAKWEFLFGTVPEDITSSANVDASTAPPSGTSSESPTPTPPFALPVRPVASEESPGFKDRLIGHNVEHVEVEFVTPPPDASFGASPKTGIIRRALKYSETDLDAVPLRCYRETNIDEVLAEQEADSAFGSNRSELGSGPGGGTLYTKANEEEEEEEVEEEDEVVSWASVRMQGDRKRQHATHEEDEVYCMLLKRPLDSLPDCPGPLKSPIPVNGPRRISEDGLDTFSRHFESILESHRAKGTSYSSLDSEELLSSSQPVFTFDLPTLTPEIQSQICESARDIIELSFAPLVQGELTSATHPADLSQSVSDATQAHAGEDEPTGDTRCEQELWDEIQPCFREKAHHRTADTDHEHGRHAGNTDTLLNGSRVDSQAARRLAKRLYHLDGFKKSDVSRHLSKNNEFNHRVAEEYLRFFDFRALPLDQALRVFLKKFALIGETQERERVLSHFSRRYFHCNPNSIPSEDSVHALTCAVMLLNTDLHGHNIGKRMSCMQFIGNLEGLNEGQNFPKDLLKMLYNSIKNEKLQWTLDEEESFSELADKRTDATSHTMKRISTGGNPFVSMAQQPGALVYKNGFLTRKVHADSDGKKTPRGKRGWKTFYAILKGLILYLQKGEYRPEKQMSDEDLKNAVSIHHSLAMRAADYSKRPNVFYLRTADWRVFLFQAPNAEQMQSWITRINTVAAMFSAPPFPAAIGSQRKFSRPLLPGSASKLTQEEQVQSHENRFRSTTSELTELRSSPPDRKVKGRELEEYRLREEYLEFEKTRYGTYAMLLRAKIRSGHNDLSTFESRLYEDNGLQRAHSSPTLQQEGGANNAPAAKARKGSRRGESQRQSYRQTVKL